MLVHLHCGIILDTDYITDMYRETKQKWNRSLKEWIDETDYYIYFGDTKVTISADDFDAIKTAMKEEQEI